MLKALFSSLFLAITIYSFAQKPPIKFGNVSEEEVARKVYAKDSSAAALVIADYGNSKLEYNQTDGGFVINFERVKRIKIFKKEGYEFATHNIQLYHQNTLEEKVSSLKGITYNWENGKMVETKMKNDAVFREKVDDNIDNVRFTLPNVKEGSVIEFSYQTTSEFLFNFQDWEFQASIPTQWSEYRVHIPEYYKYDQYMQGYVPATINETKQEPKSITISSKERLSDGTIGYRSSVSYDKIDYQETYSRWVTQDVPAFKEEPFMNNYRDYISKINFELVSTQFPNSPIKYYRGTWEALNTEFLNTESFGGVLGGSNVVLNNIVEEITAGTTDAVEKAAKIYDYVKQNVEWDGNYRKFTSDNFKRTLDSKKGNSADINLLVAAMLRKANIVADPVLISTRNHGAVREQFPISSQFNYVITCARIGEKNILLDATDRTLPINLLPERCLNGRGYVISKERQGWMDIATPVRSRTVSTFDMAIEPSGEMTGQVTISHDGYRAQKMRIAYSTKGNDEYVNEVAAARQWQINKTTIENLKNLGQLVKETHDVKVSEFAQVAGNIIYLSPMLLGKIAQNPFKLENRVYPVDFGSSFEETHTGRYTLPVGYEVDELPKSRAMALPNGAGRYNFNVSLVGDKIQITSQLIISKPLFSQTEYQNLREFYSQVVSKQAEQIVIKKK